MVAFDTSLGTSISMPQTLYVIALIASPSEIKVRPSFPYLLGILVTTLAGFGCDINTLSMCFFTSSLKPSQGRSRQDAYSQDYGGSYPYWHCR